MEQQILYAIVALVTGSGIGGGGMLLRQKHNGNGSKQLLQDIRDELRNIHSELSDLRVEVAKLYGRIS